MQNLTSSLCAFVKICGVTFLNILTFVLIKSTILAIALVYEYNNTTNAMEFQEYFQMHKEEEIMLKNMREIKFKVKVHTMNKI